MGVRLTIVRGARKGEALLFDQSEIHLGRTADNDVVLLDNRVSRRHARITERLGRHFVQDLDSAHGTQLNARRLVGEQELREGDRLLLGDVECVFERVRRAETLLLPIRTEKSDDDDEATAVGEPPQAGTSDDADDEGTDVGDSPRAGDAAGGGAGADDDGETVTGLRPDPSRLVKNDRSDTRILATPSATIPELPATPPGPGALAAPSATVPELPAAPRDPGALAAPSETVPELPAAPRGPPEAPRPSAAEQARRRRLAARSLVSRWAFWWGELPRGRRILLGGGALVCVLGGALALALMSRSADEERAEGPGPAMLGLTVLPDSFGLGDGVMWEQPDLKEFEFEFASPSRAVAVVRYHASGISREEVGISVNAVNVGWVPPDTINTTEREVQQILPPSALKRNALNRLVFDNVHNPPGRDPWRVWNLRLEINPVPELPPGELLASARVSVAQARDFYERRAMGPGNLMAAWEHYRAAWITLEALDEKPDLYQDVRYMLGQVAVDLDQQCGQLVLDFQRYIQFNDTKRAARVLEEINRHFPTEAHRCHNLAAEKAIEYGL